jgi:long-chain-alcohol oxidase
VIDDVTLALTDRQRTVLRAVCDTLLPNIVRDDDPHAYYATGALAAGTPARVEKMFEQLGNPSDRARLKILLDLLDLAPANLFQGAGFRSFARMSPTSREALLRAWAHSSIAVKRAGFQALKRLCHVAHFCWPAAGGTHPAWRAVGYPGPLPQPASASDAVPAMTLVCDTSLDCDAVIVGSGAGGGVAAGVLAENGWDVVVLEKGGNPSSGDLSQVEGDMLNSLYLDRGMLMTQSGSLPILAGSCLGGGTAINWTTSFALPDAIRAEWHRRSGLQLFEAERFGASLQRVQARLNVGVRWTTPGRRDELFERGLRALGWEVAPIPRNVTDCREGLECGYCGYGCRHGAKNSTAKTYLADAAARGARLVPHCDVSRVLIERGRAVGVEGTVRGADGRQYRMAVRARVVIVACGAIYTPVLLRRSGLVNANIGRNLHLHPVSAVVGVFPDRVDPWSGTLQARYSTQVADMDGNGYGARFETGPLHFALPASAFGWENPRQLRDDVGKLGHASVVGILLRDRDVGRVAVARSGHPRVHYEVSRYDAAHMRTAIRAGAEVLAAAGATELFTLQTPPARSRPGGQGWLDRFMADADAIGYRHIRMSYISFHQMATAAMGCDPQRGAIAETGETFDVRGLYVADGSAFPGSSGVNPMITIMAVADHVAQSIAERG